MHGGTCFVAQLASAVQHFRYRTDAHSRGIRHVANSRGTREGTGSQTAIDAHGAGNDDIMAWSGKQISTEASPVERLARNVTSLLARPASAAAGRGRARERRGRRLDTTPERPSPPGRPPAGRATLRPGDCRS